jgi:hypothetical protein
MIHCTCMRYRPDAHDMHRHLYQLRHFLSHHCAYCFHNHHHLYIEFNTLIFIIIIIAIIRCQRAGDCECWRARSDRRGSSNPHCSNAASPHTNTCAQKCRHTYAHTNIHMHIRVRTYARYGYISEIFIRFFCYFFCLRLIACASILYPLLLVLSLYLLAIFHALSAVCHVMVTLHLCLTLILSASLFSLNFFSSSILPISSLFRAWRKLLKFFLEPSLRPSGKGKSTSTQRNWQHSAQGLSGIYLWIVSQIILSCLLACIHSSWSHWINFQPQLNECAY